MQQTSSVTESPKDPARIAGKLGELAQRQLRRGLSTAARQTVETAAHLAFLADPTLREVDADERCD